MHTRLEAGRGEERRFWEITVTGQAVTTRYGRVGTDGRASKTNVFSSPAHAHAEAQRRIAEKRKGGFEPVSEPVGAHVGGHASAPDLVAAILDAEDDDEGGYLVYADWLLSQGNPRGELIMLQHGLAKKPHDARMRRAERNFQREHGGRMLPPRLAEILRLRSDDQPESGSCHIEWKLGFVHRARIGRSLPHPPYTVRELLLDLLDHPSAQLLRELTIGALGPGRTLDYRRYDYTPVVEALCQAAPASLRTLFLADFAPEHVDLSDSRLGSVSGLFRSLPRLKDVHLRGGSLELGDIHAPALQRFCLTTHALGPEVLAGLDSAYWPALEALVIDAQGTALDMSALPSLLAAHGTPSLRALAIRHTTDTRAIWAALARSSLLGQLALLDLSHGDLSDHDVSAMTAQGREFGHLERLVLDGNYISRLHRAEVRALAAEVSLAEQRGAAADLPRITTDQIIDFAPDVRSYMAAREVADPRKWPQLGSWMNIVWGRCQGNSLYDVFVDLANLEAGCTCPSSKYPCKHALGLLIIATHGRLIPVMAPPEGLIEACRASRYEAFWE